MSSYGSLSVLICPYVFLWILVGPIGLLSVPMCAFWSLWVLISPDECLWILMVSQGSSCVHESPYLPL